MASFIADGFDRDAFIEAALPEKNGDSIHDSLEFKYRPATRQESLKLDGEMNIIAKNVDIDPMALYRMDQAVNKFLAGKLISWNLTDNNGVLVQITAENFEKVQPILQNKIYQIVRGTRLSDKKPNASEPKSDEAQLKNS